MADVRIYTKKKGAASSGSALGTGAVTVNLSPYLRKDDAEAVYLSREGAARVYLRRSVLDDMFTKVCVSEAKDAVTDADGNVTQAAVAARWAIRANYDLYGVGGVSAYGLAADAANTGAGVSSFAELSEVSALAPSDGQVWGYKDGAFKWVDAAAGGASGASRFADLTDVGGGTAGQVWGRTSGGYGWVDAAVDLSRYLTKSSADGYYQPKGSYLTASALGALTLRNGTQTLGTYTPTAAQSVDLSGLVSGCLTSLPSHTHTRSQITDFAHTHVVSQVTGLQSALDGKAAVSHTHSQYAERADLATVATSGDYADLTNKPEIPIVLDYLTSLNSEAALSAYQGRVLKGLVDGKAAAAHNHDWSDITSGKPTTLVGYGIENAYTQGEANNKFVNVTDWQQIGGTKIFTGAETEIQGVLTLTRGVISKGGKYILELNDSNNTLTFGWSTQNSHILQFGGTRTRFVTNNNTEYFTASPQLTEINSVNGLKIGPAYISWDPDNSALKIADADGGGSINVYASGGVSAYGGLGTYETVPDAHVTGRLTVSGSIRMDGTAFVDSELRMGGNAITGATSVAASGAVTAGSVTAGSVTATGNVSAATVTVNGNQIRELSHSGQYIYINIGGARYKVSATQTT